MTTASHFYSVLFLASLATACGGDDDHGGADGTGGLAGAAGSSASGGSTGSGGTSGNGSPNCSGAFGEPTLVVGGDATRVTTPTLTDDELEMFYAVGPSGAEQPYVTRRMTTSEDFPAGQLVTELDICGSVSLDISGDGLRLYFVCTPDITQDGELMLFERGSRSEPFTSSRVIGVAGLSVNLSDDELTLYYSPRPGQLQRASRNSLGEDFGTPEVVPELATTTFYAPDLAPDDRSLYGGVVNDELAVAVRQTSDSPFGAPTIIPDPFDVAGAPAINRSCRNLYFIGVSASTGAQVWGIYEMSR